jgi:hypothetical protein
MYPSSGRILGDHKTSSGRILGDHKTSSGSHTIF